jgi:hypothetical protein
MSGEEVSCPTLVGDIRKLDQEYCELSEQEGVLVSILRRLQEEETALRHALREAMETGGHRMQQDLRQKDEAAIARLEQALMESSSDEDVTGPDVQSLFSFTGGSTVHNRIDFSDARR